MSIEVSTLAWESDVGPLTTRVVLLALAESADKHGYCWPGVKHISDRAGVNRASTFRALRQLETEGLIARTQRRRTNGSQRSNAYQINLDELRKRARKEAAAEHDVLSEALDTQGRIDGANALKLVTEEPPW